MKRFLLWLVFLFCLFKMVDEFLLTGRLFHWIREKGIRGPVGTAAIQRSLQKELTLYQNPQAITLISGRVLEGAIVRENEEGVTIRQYFGHSGYLEETLPKSEIKGVVRHDHGPAEILPEEIAIKREFPEFHMFKRTHHTFFTDSDFFFIERIVTLLERLHEDFLKEFASVAKGQSQRSFVLIFSHEKAYQTYAKKVSAALEHSAGFYTFGGKRLALYNQFQSALFGEWEKEVTEIREKIRERREEAQRYRASDPDRAYRATQEIMRAEERLRRHQQRVNAAFDETTVMVILHEGSHQLLHANGLHETPLSQLPWLVEGLATYCETPTLGGRNQMREFDLREMVQQGKPIPLSQFLQVHSESDFIRQGETAYAQAWSFVYFLMKEHREAFFRFLERTNRQTHSLFVPGDRPIRWLEEELGKDLPEIEQEWRTFIQRVL